MNTTTADLLTAALSIRSAAMRAADAKVAAALIADGDTRLVAAWMAGKLAPGVLTDRAIAQLGQVTYDGSL